jgi:acyl carrier protein
MPDVAQVVKAVIAKKIPDKTAPLELTDNLREIGLESIDALEMIFDLEEKFGIQIPYNANSSDQEFATVGDVVAAIERLIAGKS